MFHKFTANRLLTILHYPRPGNRESVRIHIQLRHQANVFLSNVKKIICALLYIIAKNTTPYLQSNNEPESISDIPFGTYYFLQWRETCLIFMILVTRNSAITSIQDLSCTRNDPFISQPKRYCWVATISSKETLIKHNMEQHGSQCGLSKSAHNLFCPRLNHVQYVDP